MCSAQVVLAVKKITFKILKYMDTKKLVFCRLPILKVGIHY